VDLIAASEAALAAAAVAAAAKTAMAAEAVAEAETARDEAMDEVSSLQRALQQAEEKTARVRTPRYPLVFWAPCRFLRAAHGRCSGRRGTFQTQEGPR
jgi:hypothetical protein